MLNAINGALQMLLQGPGGIHPLDVDVKFDMPTEEWVNSLTRPTISFFLYELCENTEKRDTSPRTTVVGTRGIRRMPPRRIDLFYMVSVLTADVEDEHELLWRVLATLLRFGDLPEAVLPEPLRVVEPSMTARIAARDERPNLLELWNALATKPHPALAYVLTAPMDLLLAIEAPLVLTRTARYRRGTHAVTVPADFHIQIGGIVRDTSGRVVPGVTITAAGRTEGSVTNAEGRYVLQGLSPGRVVLQISRESAPPRSIEVVVPGDSYDIVIDAIGMVDAEVT